jgi:TetR/AcrR family transcriptional regulator, transcriptional repressor for nem operon
LGKKLARLSLKDEILQAGVDRLTAKGYGATSVQDITDAAGAPKGSFYNHFRSKEHLAVEALNLYQMSLDPERLQDSSIPPLKRLRKHFEFMISRIEANDFRSGCLMGGLAAFVDDEQPLIQQAVSAAYSDVISAIAAVLGEAKGLGELPSDQNLRELAGVIFDAWEGALLRARVEGRRRPLNAFLSVIFDQLIPGLAP